MKAKQASLATSAPRSRIWSSWRVRRTSATRQRMCRSRAAPQRSTDMQEHVVREKVTIAREAIPGADAAISRQELQGDCRHHSAGHQSAGAHAARGASRRQPGRPPSTRRLCAGRVPTADQSRRARCCSRSKDCRSPRLVPGDRIELKSVKLGRNLGDDVEVVSGLSVSDWVVKTSEAQASVPGVKGP